MSNRTENATELLYHEVTELPPSKPHGVMMLQTNVISYVAVIPRDTTRGHVIEQTLTRLGDEWPLNVVRTLAELHCTDAEAIRQAIRLHDTRVKELGGKQ